MLTSIAIIIALTTFVATALHMSQQSSNRQVPLKQMWKLKPYQDFDRVRGQHV